MKFKQFLTRYPLLPAFAFAAFCSIPAFVSITEGLILLAAAFVTTYLSDKFIGPKENVGRIALALVVMVIILCPWIGTAGQIVAACTIIVTTALVTPRRIKLKKWIYVTIYAITSLWFITLFVISCAR